MRVFYINLDHRLDRRAYMEAQFEALGIRAERLRATMPAEIVPADLAPVTMEEARRGLTPREIATSVSHHRAWRHMLDQGERHALILEDDCQLSPRLPAFLEAYDRLGGVAGLVRIETRLRRQIVARRASMRIEGIGLHRTFVWEWGTAAYIMTAGEARRILASEHRFVLPIDDTLLSQESRLHRRHRVLQTVPALAFVPDEAATVGTQPASVRESDVQAERQTRFQYEKPKEQVKKIVREVRRIQRQIADVRQTLNHRIFGRTGAVPFADGLPAEGASGSPAPSVPPSGAPRPA